MKGRIAIAVGLIAIVLAGIAVKIFCFPSVKDAYFAMNYRGMRGVPPGLVVLRPTRYPFLKHADPMYAPSPNSRTNFWIMGRNAPFRDLIAAAFDEQPSQVALPPDAPKGNFDFLVTVAQSRERLQEAIQKKLHCRAYTELRETDVLALKVINPDLPGLKISDPGSRRTAFGDNAKIHFSDMPVMVVAGVLKQFYGLNVVDKTGLTNFYDFSLPLPVMAARQRSDAELRTNADDYIKDLGLGLETDTAVDEVLVVKTGSPTPPVLADKKQILLGPLNPGAEEGSEHWYHGMDGKGELLIDSTDAASGDSDFTVDNRSTDRHDHADWRSEIFSLRAATSGARPVRFSFDYKLPGPVNDGDNVRVQLRFYDQGTNFINQQEFWVGSKSHDSAMTSYKTIANDDINPPAGARACDVTLTANVYDGDNWSSGIARFDNILVTTRAP